MVDLNVSFEDYLGYVLMLKYILAFAVTLRGIVMDYLRSLSCDHGVLLQESLFPVLHYLYLDLVRGSVRDHLKGVGFGPSEELLKFSAELRLGLGKFYNKQKNFLLMWSLIIVFRYFVGFC